MEIYTLRVKSYKYKCTVELTYGVNIASLNKIASLNRKYLNISSLNKYGWSIIPCGVSVWIK